MPGAGCVSCYFINYSNNRKMKNVLKIVPGITMLGLIAIAISSCSKNKSNNVAIPNQKKINVQSNATLGKIVVDKDGRSLYFFSNDADGANTCTGGCTALWTPFYVDNLSGDELGDATLKMTDFASITTASNQKQLTYKGWPLYYYTPNGVPEAPNVTGGEGIGGIWFVAKPDYTIMLANKQLIGGDDIHYKSDYTAGDGNTIFFTDAAGNTLYTFSKDSANINKFTKSDFTNETIFSIYDTTKIWVPSVLDKTLFTNTDVFGRNQLSYKGWPLYHFGADGGVRGSTKGITFGAVGKWPVPVKGILDAPTE